MRRRTTWFCVKHCIRKWDLTCLVISSHSTSALPVILLLLSTSISRENEAISLCSAGEPSGSTRIGLPISRLAEMRCTMLRARTPDSTWSVALGRGGGRAVDAGGAVSPGGPTCGIPRGPGVAMRYALEGEHDAADVGVCAVGLGPLAVGVDAGLLAEADEVLGRHEGTVGQSQRIVGHFAHGKLHRGAVRSGQRGVPFPARSRLFICHVSA